MASKIELLIDEIEDYIGGCKFQLMSNSNIIVNKNEIDELLRELRHKTPEEIKLYQKMVANREEILNDARNKAQTLINEATVHTNELINEHEIMQQAYAQANQIVNLATQQAQDILDQATMEANEVKTAATAYTDGILENVEQIITHTLDVANHQYGTLLDSLQNCNDIVKGNRMELVQEEVMLEDAVAEPNLDII